MLRDEDRNQLQITFANEFSDTNIEHERSVPQKRKKTMVFADSDSDYIENEHERSRRKQPQQGLLHF